MRYLQPIKILATCLAVTAICTASASPAWAQNSHANNPSGNIGTIKIDAVPFDTNPNNEPHVGCVFQVNAFGYGSNTVHPTVQVETQAPTKPAGIIIYHGTMSLDQDSHAGGGSQAGYDGSLTIDLNQALMTYSSQANHGYHLKISVDGDGPGKNQAKTKTFWVDNCQTPVVRPSVTPMAAVGGTTITPESGQILSSAINLSALRELPNTGPIDGYLIIPVLTTAIGAMIAKFRFGIGR